MPTTARIAILSLLCSPGGSMPAQGWNHIDTTSNVAFGNDGSFVADDGQGLVGYDEFRSRTLLPTDAGWVELPAAPASRQSATFASSATAVFLFGGVLAGGTLANDLWRFDRGAGDWQLLNAGGIAVPAPTPRSGARATEFAGAIGILLFGGMDATGPRNDTWIAIPQPAGALWFQQITPTAPPPRTGHAMARGPGQTIVLFGGANPTVLGDCWIFTNNAWIQHSGATPPPGAGARMTYDVGREMTVLLHPNGETWEWNGFGWRRVGVTATPSWAKPALAFDPSAGVRAFQPSSSGLEQYVFTPSPAAFELTQDNTCSQVGGQDLQLDAYQRSLPILGQDLHLRASGMQPNSAFLGVYELATNFSLQVACGCFLGVTGVGAGMQFVPGVGSHRDWLLPIANDVMLIGLSFDVQGIVLDPTNACWLAMTQRGTLTPGY
ncbi:MAG TPA: kelch repeat-containing protein [Planctomycetota bacterium]|nr:kelch repeat-containing protein [Planctomycetota bacterium]